MDGSRRRARSSATAFDRDKAAGGAEGGVRARRSTEITSRTRRRRDERRKSCGDGFVFVCASSQSVLVATGDARTG
jgi:hypothetical protein